MRRYTAALLAQFLVFAPLQVSAGDTLGLPALKTGDIVFQESGNSQSAAIALASSSSYTHTGLVEIDSSGRKHVVEATGPVRSTPLEAWIAHGVGGRVTIKRVKGLADADAKKVLAAAHVHDGKPYDIYFYNGRDAIYCSELVYAAFKDGASLEVGRPEKIGALKIGHEAVQSLIAARWKQHPACVAAKSASLEACMPHLLEETLVTPGSIARDARLETVFTNFVNEAD